MTQRHALHAVGADSAVACNRKRQKKLIKAAKANKTLPMKGGDLPVGGLYPLTCLGVTSEAFGDALGEYVRSNPDSSLTCEPLLCVLVSSSNCILGFCQLDPLPLKLFLSLRVSSCLTLGFINCLIISLKLLCPLHIVAAFALLRCTAVTGSAIMQSNVEITSLCCINTVM